MSGLTSRRRGGAGHAAAHPRVLVRVLLPAVVAVLLGACGAAAGPVEGAGPPVAPGSSTAAPGRSATSVVSVRIPAIEVDEPSPVRLGLAPDGSAEVPTDYGQVGWFDRPAALPAGRGPTVLLGHVDSRDGPAVFFRLRDLRAGDVVEVGRGDGTVARYAVERTEQVAKDRFPTFAVFGATPDDVLRLVTCAGAFDRGARSYTDNLVVHAVRVT